MSAGEEALALHLDAVGIPYEREYRFAPPRRWRFDFYVGTGLAVEVDGGSWNGGHRRGAQADAECEKMNEALFAGYDVLHFTPAMVNSGEALKTIERALGRTHD